MLVHWAEQWALLSSSIINVCTIPRSLLFFLNSFRLPVLQYMSASTPPRCASSSWRWTRDAKKSWSDVLRVAATQRETRANTKLWKHQLKIPIPTLLVSLSPVQKIQGHCPEKNWRYPRSVCILSLRTVKFSEVVRFWHKMCIFSQSQLFLQGKLNWDWLTGQRIFFVKTYMGRTLTVYEGSWK